MGKKIVFFCIPAHGHTNPTLGVVRELTGRGHQVWYYSYLAFRQQIEEAGAKFIACDEYDAQQKITPRKAARVGKDLALSTRILTDTTLSLDAKVCQDMERLAPDCIVADSMAVWGKAVAFKMNIPFVSSTTTFAFNRCSAAIMKQSPWELFAMLLSMPGVNRNIRRLKENGFPIRNVLDIMQNDENTDTIVYTSAQFQPCADTFLERYAFVGPSIRPARKRIEKKREKLVYISMGTVNNNMLRFYKNCITALGRTPFQVILSVGSRIRAEDLGRLPENISVFSFVDQMAVLMEADVFLSHCGMNSVNESLACRVPLVLCPQTAEQRGVAARVAQLAAGLPLKKKTPGAILEAVNRVMDTPSFAENAARIAQGFAKCSGAKGAADKILLVCGER